MGREGEPRNLLPTLLDTGHAREELNLSDQGTGISSPELAPRYRRYIKLDFDLRLTENTNLATTVDHRPNERLIGLSLLVATTTIRKKKSAPLSIIILDAGTGAAAGAMASSIANPLISKPLAGGTMMPGL